MKKTMLKINYPLKFWRILIREMKYLRNIPFFPSAKLNTRKNLYPKVFDENKISTMQHFPNCNKKTEKDHCFQRTPLYPPFDQHSGGEGLKEMKQQKNYSLRQPHLMTEEFLNLLSFFPC